MRQTVVAVFDRYEAARHAAELLQDSGFGPDSVHVTESVESDVSSSGTSAVTRDKEGGVLESVRNFFADLFSADDDQSDVGQYSEVVRRGGAIVKVDVEDEPKVDLVRSTLESAGAIDIEEQAARWGQASEADSSVQVTGETAKPPKARRASARSAQEEEQVIPVVKENVEVGKRAIGTGGVRVYAHTVERPVSESVQLHEERAKVERRPVDRPATSEDVDAFKDRTIEVQEMTEKPVVHKSARVVEEVAVGKEASDRTETIKETVRDTEVKTERMGEQSKEIGASRVRPYEACEADFRSNYQSRYAASGGSFDDYAPAYRYGHSLWGDDRYAGREWSDIESDVRSDWEARNPGSPWERFKDAVRHAWERAKSD